jgi:hypothetical protein
MIADRDRKHAARRPSNSAKHPYAPINIAKQTTWRPGRGRDTTCSTHATPVTVTSRGITWPPNASSDTLRRWAAAHTSDYTPSDFLVLFPDVAVKITMGRRVQYQNGELIQLKGPALLIDMWEKVLL